MELLSHRYRIFILTIRHNRSNTIRQLMSLGLDKYHTYIIEANKKETMEQIPDLRIMVGDTENDILPANEIGIETIAVTTGIRNESLLKAMRPTLIVDSLGDIKNLLR